MRADGRRQVYEHQRNPGLNLDILCYFRYTLLLSRNHNVRASHLVSCSAVQWTSPLAWHSQVRHPHVPIADDGYIFFYIKPSSPTFVCASSLLLFATRHSTSLPRPAALPAAAPQPKRLQVSDIPTWKHFNKRAKRSLRQQVRTAQWSVYNDDPTPYPIATSRPTPQKAKVHKHKPSRRTAVPPQAAAKHSPRSTDADASQPKHSRQARSFTDSATQDHILKTLLQRVKSGKLRPGASNAAPMSTMAYGAKLTPTTSWTPLSGADLAGILSPTPTDLHTTTAQPHDGARPRSGSDHRHEGVRSATAAVHGTQHTAGCAYEDVFFRVECAQQRAVAERGWRNVQAHNWGWRPQHKKRRPPGGHDGRRSSRSFGGRREGLGGERTDESPPGGGVCSGRSRGRSGAAGTEFAPRFKGQQYAWAAMHEREGVFGGRESDGMEREEVGGREWVRFLAALTHMRADCFAIAQVIKNAGGVQSSGAGVYEHPSLLVYV